MLARRWLSTPHRLKCGLEIHTQLRTRHKLFSLAPTAPAAPNASVAFFDVGLPGTQPTLNPEALYLALRLAAALGCRIHRSSAFDRKHYFYPDQPLGYQLTQHYHPLATGGAVQLTAALDGLDHRVRLTQLQIEQDTAKTSYAADAVHVDYNRANVPLVELVTEPDFDSLAQVRSFVKKYQLLVKTLGVCSGDLETGAMRVDVNVSIDGGHRVEIKNLGSTGEIEDAVQFEFRRQVQALESGRPVSQQTRGWNGKETVLLRSKEDAVDYRYFPDPELPLITLDKDIHLDLLADLPELPDQTLARLLDAPYGLEIKHARFLVNNPDICSYYFELFDLVPGKTANNWLIHEFLGAFNKLGVDLDLSLVPAKKLASLILKAGGEITPTAAKTVLVHMITSPDKSVDQLIQELGLAKPTGMDDAQLDKELESICLEIMDAHADVVDKIKNGKPKSINFLLGQAMRETQGRVSSDQFLAKFKQLLHL